MLGGRSKSHVSASQVLSSAVKHGDVEEAKKLSKSATKKKKYDDDCIYDCDYVKGRVEEYRVRESLSM